MKIDSLESLLVHELKDLYSAERQFSDALPKMADAASHAELKAAFREHLEETKGQIQRLEEVFKHFDYQPGGEHCDAAEGLVSEGEEIIKDIDDGAVRDAALVGAGQRVEHYEIAGYGTAAALAKELGLQAVHEMLTETLEEESEADRKLTKVAERVVNSRAMQPA